ncbi:MAG: Gfo/Idh/MocA family oxidoreductase [Candidatus Marinimicrobia bacterium]|nr:Gfo/Idh/MocA family oxidoreductase [Candidatus Neomarinimicrobiota bacterium]MCF7828551.1 Gfo/Idh/MocA family oxidoreductase [Candidatus Neomarinimicrobiota bacterium]MCF7880292.1 Gfo/Idh/MocA family oxidoreductase [Candidatus Neomarinimicrobiota bacterium]
MQLAVIGAGHWGKNLIRNFHELDNLHGIVEYDEQRLAGFVEQYPEAEGFSSVESVLSREDYTAVVVATPAETHYPIAKQALEAGKDVYVEKPIALHVSEAEELHRIATDNDRILMVGHLLLYHPAIIKIKQMIEAGELGRVYQIYSHRLNLGKVRQEENALWSFAPHDISVILHVLGTMPDRISCQGGMFLQPNIHDVTLTTLEFPDNQLAHIHVSWLHPFKEHRLVVVGSKKMLTYEDSAPEKELRLYDRGIDWTEGEPIPRKNDWVAVEYPDTEPLKNECQHFLECIDSRKQPLSDGQNGIDVLQVLESAQRGLTEKESQAVRKQKHPGVHETAVVDENVTLGEGTKVWHFSHVLKDTTIGDNCTLGQNVMVGPKVTVGNHVKIQNNVSVYEGVELEDYVFCGPSMVFTNIVNPRSKYPQRGSEYYIKTLVKKGASIGANATVVCGITLGQFCFIGAGAVVTKDVPDFALVVGNPGRIIGWMCECGTRLRFDDGQATCDKCGREYRKEDEERVVQEGRRE